MATQKLEQQLCTGIVILPNLVLTARHCLTVDRAAIEGDDCASAIIAEPPADVRVSILPASDVDLVLASNELLTRSGGCEGDSGGPAIDANGSVFAIAARSSADCSESAYLTLASYAGWLKTATRYAAEAGEFDVPAWVTSADAVETPSDVTEMEPNAVDARARGGCTVTVTVTAPGNGRGTGAFVLLSLLFAIVGIARRRVTVRASIQSIQKFESILRASCGDVCRSTCKGAIQCLTLVVVKIVAVIGKHQPHFGSFGSHRQASTHAQ
jgi:hypothetical protein